MQTINPATGDSLDTYEQHSSAAVNDKLDNAAETFRDWRERPIERREELAAALGDILRENTREYAELMVREMGKPINQAVAEVEKCADLCDYYAERSAEHLQDERIGAVPGTKTYVSYEPLGPVLAVMPWNYPFWQVFRFAVPTLTAGNVGLLKHAPNVLGCAEAIEEIFREAGYPDGSFTSLQVDEETVSDVIADDRVRAVTLTGSTRAGRAVAATSGENLKKTVLELGGSDPFVVLDDAPIDDVVESAVTARNQNSGQTCIAAKRFFVHVDIYEEFVEAFTEEAEQLTVGDPFESDTDVGPLARDDLLETLHTQVQQSVEAGATVETGGEPLDREGNFYAPTVLTDVPEDCPASSEELFGPVAAMFPVAGDDEAVARANDTQFGLGGSVWTADSDRGEALAQRIDTGNVFVNQIVKSDPRLPFGGIKDSGYGSELSCHGIREFTNTKTIWVE